MAKYKLAIEIQYNGETFTSNFAKKADEKETIGTFVKAAADGELDHLSFNSGNKKHYFPKLVLKNSVISVVQKSYWI